MDKLRESCPAIDFLAATALSPEDAKNILKGDAEVDGYVAYMIGGWAKAADTIAATGRPTLYVDDLYSASGEFLMDYAAARRRGWKLGAVTSSRFEDVAEAVWCFALLKKPGGSPEAFAAACDAARKKSIHRSADMSCPTDLLKEDVAGAIKKLRGLTVLAIGGHWPNVLDQIGPVFGAKVLTMNFKELQAAYEAADRDEARKWADRWIREAEKVIEPSLAEIEKSAVMYLAMCKLLERHKARAITINCLGGFYGGHLKAYPCLGYRQLNNDCRVGACEGDLLSMMTMLAITYLAGRSGFISDPVLDTSKNRVIYAHCVAMNKVFGPECPVNPFHIRSHSEDRKGAAIRSLMPLGRLVTTLAFIPCAKK